MENFQVQWHGRLSGNSGDSDRTRVHQLVGSRYACTTVFWLLTKDAPTQWVRLTDPAGQVLDEWADAHWLEKVRAGQEQCPFCRQSPCICNWYRVE